MWETRAGHWLSTNLAPALVDKPAAPDAPGLQVREEAAAIGPRFDKAPPGYAHRSICHEQVPLGGEVDRQIRAEARVEVGRLETNDRRVRVERGEVFGGEELGVRVRLRIR